MIVKLQRIFFFNFSQTTFKDSFLLSILYPKMLRKFMNRKIEEMSFPTQQHQFISSHDWIQYFCHKNGFNLNLPLIFKGFCYQYGFKVLKYEKKAIKYYKLAMEKGDSDAITCLGLCYENGVSVLKNEKKAVEYYKLAMEKEDSRAITCLGM